MLRRIHSPAIRYLSYLLLTVTAAFAPARSARALIVGGVGNMPIADPGWPKGGTALINNPLRVAWWEGPGGQVIGQWNADCRGDAQAFSAVLGDFTKLEVKAKRVVVHDGVGQSYLLNPGRWRGTTSAEANIDWTASVWQKDHWNPTENEEDPEAQIEVYTGGKIRWADVVVPEGLKIVDERLEAHGFSRAGGLVLTGTVRDLITGRPIPARLRLEQIEPRPDGSDRFIPAAEVRADARGQWVLKNGPVGIHRLVAEADGYVPTVAADFLRIHYRPQRHQVDAHLARPAHAAGRVIDPLGRPLAGVDVQLQQVIAKGGGYYGTLQPATTRTGADGRFRLDRQPVGTATVWVSKPGHCRPGPGLAIAMPVQNLTLRMIAAATVRVTVEFPVFDRPAEYVVEIVPEGDPQVGAWQGTAILDDKDQVTFRDAPPGRYVLRGRPNPHSPDQISEPVALELKGGATAEVTLLAK
jgi:hypothetical protein